MMTEVMVAPVWWRRVLSVNRWGLGVLFIGALALLGWTFRLRIASSLWPTWPPMRPIAAVWLVLLGGALIWPVRTRRHSVPVVLGVIVMVAALISLAQSAFHLGPILEELLFGDRLRARSEMFPGRPSPHVALAMLMLATSITLGHLHVRAAITEALALGASLIPAAGLLGYALRKPLADLVNSGTWSVGMAANTAIALLFVAMGIISRSPTDGAHAFMSGTGAAKQLVRHLLAPILFLPVVIGMLLITVTSSGRLEYPFTVALGLACIGTTLAYLTLQLAHRISGQELELAYRARYDALTGVVNRATFTDMVTQSLDREGHRADEAGILYVDVDNFKTINDTYGHADGDAVLRALSEKLLNATRGSDVVGRLGGDEFAILMRNVQADSDLRVVAERALTSLAEPVALRSTEVVVSVTIGIARGAAGMALDELTRNADLAMYRAKHLGKGRYEMFTPELYESAHEQQNTDAEFSAAIHREELRMHYQPIIDLRTGELQGVEALVRWQHPQRGLLLPAAFIAAAERTGAIVPMGRWAIRQACRDASEWMRAGASASLTLAINISARELSDATLVEDVASALATSGLAPDRLVMEITETAIMSDLEVSLPILHGLKGLGIRIAIDDFGTGYSSLSYLQELPVDILKIDKSFVDGVAHGGIDRALARTIVALSETLSLQTIAEGVESSSQWQQLEDIGCAYGQGYHFSQAVPAAEMACLLAEQSGEKFRYRHDSGTGAAWEGQANAPVTTGAS